jgi:hypothetical protein
MSDKLVELAFQRALENGELDNLRGAGKPIEKSSLTTDPFAHVFGESGVMSPLGALQRRIDAAQAQLKAEDDAEKRRAIRLEIAALETRKQVEMETFKRYM